MLAQATPLSPPPTPLCDRQVEGLVAKQLGLKGLVAKQHPTMCVCVCVCMCVCVCECFAS